MSKYDFELDLDSENSLSIIIDMIKPKSRILEFGPATGRLTRYLNEKMNCDIDIVEIDEEAGLKASKYSNNSFIGGVLGDIEKYEWLEEVKNEKYDYIVFADVLEHLRFPDKVLKKCNTLLKENGSIIVSVPNIAHNSVIIDLINDEFKYNELGLLDNTHITFFSYKSLKRMIYESGYQITIEKAVYSKVGDNEIQNNYNSVNKELAKALRMRKKGNLYQFIFKLQKKEYVTLQAPIREVNLDINAEYEFVCYVRENIDDTYNEAKTIRKFINPNYNRIELDFSKFKEIYELRIDPNTCNCIIDIKDIYTIVNDEKVNIDILYTNGINLYDSTYIFSTIDPQIFLDVKGMNIKKLYYECQFIDYDSNNIRQYELIMNQIITNNNIKLKEKEDMLKEKEDVIKEKENIIQNNEKIIKEKENIIKQKENIIKQKENIINQIENSKKYKLLKMIGKTFGK